MKHLSIPITSIDGSKDLTRDQRNLLVILEDATLMFVRDEIQFLRSLPEIMHGAKLTDSYCVKVLSVIERRMKQIRRGWGRRRQNSTSPLCLRPWTAATPNAPT